MNVRVICIGNEVALDDGIGIRVGRVLEKLPLPPGVVVHTCPRIGLELLDLLEGQEHLIVVDAMHTGQTPPGTCTTLTMDDVETMNGTLYSIHGLGLSEALQVLQAMNPAKMPAKTTVVGIEALMLHEFGTSLSPPVRAALPTAVERTLQALGASDTLLAQGVAHAKNVMHWDPQPLEAYGG